jgi:hypothetical protein
MTHIIAIWLPEKPILKYPLAPLLPFERKYHIADFTEFSASWDSKTSTLLSYKRKRFFGWMKRELGAGFECPIHRHDVGVIGYYGWKDVSIMTSGERNVESIENKSSGWVLIGDNHDSSGDFLWAALWFDIITNLKDVEVWTRHPFANENSYMYSETKKITMTDFTRQFLRENIKGLTLHTNPLSQPNAILLSKKSEDYTYIALPSISLEDIHESI